VQRMGRAEVWVRRGKRLHCSCEHVLVGGGRWWDLKVCGETVGEIRRQCLWIQGKRDRAGGVEQVDRRLTGSGGQVSSEKECRVGWQEVESIASGEAVGGVEDGEG
jgi:hypothetical protein